MLDNFVVLDFETANPKRASVCQIGVAKVVGGKVAAVHTYPVCPPRGFEVFHPNNIAVHHLTPSYIEGAPDWPELLDRLVRFTGGLPLLGHNVAFERSVINAATIESGLEVPEFDYECTMKLAKH
ncbi:MAG: hypothetical protein L0J68_13190 [Micrococcaceae bacterium]|uniref:hypothetical protein n=1 Tax=unclassified Arthrobacter TaxID=235627 RepID=UPI00264B6A61|nr:hypothetical protein [Micrococcaceae bacterium]MDN5906355.1 hypothetical protein [Micrococcaceae bacterium]MDN6301203.1 hypothetical protein [Micrococcaceae bacterium]